MGYDNQALRSVIDILAEERKYDAIEICVKKDAAQAIRVYMNAGFVDTGFTDPDATDSYILRFDFA